MTKREQKEREQERRNLYAVRLQEQEDKAYWDNMDPKDIHVLESYKGGG